MRPLRRRGVHKAHSAKKFRKGAGRTRQLNMRPPPMRGGFRI